MSIIVVCPGCRKRFQADEKFAGKTGTCPNCKGEIRVPTKEEEVKIHAPGEAPTVAGAPGSNLVIKPLERLDKGWGRAAAIAIGASVVVALVAAWLGGRAGIFRESLLARGVGLLLISPPLVIAGYTFLRQSEDLDPYRGRQLWLRAAICSLVYVVLWWVYGYVADQVLTGELWTWFYVAPPFFLVGSLAALSCLDLDPTTAFFHFSFYVLATVLLRAAAGLGWVWQMPADLTTLGMSWL